MPLRAHRSDRGDFGATSEEMPSVRWRSPGGPRNLLHQGKGHSKRFRIEDQAWSSWVGVGRVEMGIRCEVYMRVAASEEQVVIEPCTQVHRPSGILVRAGRLRGARDYHVVNVRVGGNCVEVCRGEVSVSIQCFENLRQSRFTALCSILPNARLPLASAPLYGCCDSI